MEDDLAGVPELPEDAVLLHIGPYKTGTTAIQAALGAHREDLAAHGVLYPGQGRNHHRAAWSLRGRGTTGIEGVRPAEWQSLAAEVAAHPGRAVISSEFFTAISDAETGEIIDRLGSDRLRVVLTVRSLERLLPSDWQERVKTHGYAETYDSWLREVLDPHSVSWSHRLFWRLYGVRSLMARWLKVLPADHLILIVADESDRDRTSRIFEALLGLPSRLLTQADAGSANASLSADRIELVRRVNEVFERREWGDKNLRRYVHRGLLEELRRHRPGPTDPAMPGLPGWASDRVVKLSRERAKTVVDSGAVVLGRPDDLLYVPGSRPHELPDPPSTIAITAATQAVEGAVEAALAREQALLTRLAALRERQRAPFDGEPATALARELARRVRRRARRLVAR